MPPKKRIRPPTTDCHRTRGPSPQAGAPTERDSRTVGGTCLREWGPAPKIGCRKGVPGSPTILLRKNWLMRGASTTRGSRKMERAHMKGGGEKCKEGKKRSHMLRRRALGCSCNHLCRRVVDVQTSTYCGPVCARPSQRQSPLLSECQQARLNPTWMAYQSSGVCHS